MAPAPNGGLYVGTSPDGKVYKVDRNGSATTFFDPEDKYIWALAVDGRGNVYAGTGDKGVIYKIAPDGKGVPFYKTKATHATALAFDKAGNLLVGTESPGKVFRVDRRRQGLCAARHAVPGDPRAAFRRQRPAVRRRAERPAGAARGPPRRAARETTSPPGDAGRALVPSVSVSTEITSIAIVDGSGAPTTAGSGRDDRRTSKGAVYRIMPDGLWDLVWESRDDSPYDVIFDQSGAPIIATGNKGKLYRLEGDPLRPTLLTRAGAQQVTAFYKDPRGQVYFATANPGKLFRLSSERATRGTYESEPRDAQMVATWGTLSWRGTVPKGSQVELSTRSGNTETPDDTWSPWSARIPRPTARRSRARKRATCSGARC